MGSWVTLLVERDIVGHVRLRDLLVGKEGVAWCKFGVSWHEDRGHDRGFHPLVVIGVDTHLGGHTMIQLKLEDLVTSICLDVNGNSHMSRGLSSLCDWRSGHLHTRQYITCGNPFLWDT